MKMSYLGIWFLTLGLAVSACGKKDKKDDSSKKPGPGSGDGVPTELKLATDNDFEGALQKQEDGTFAYFFQYKLELAEKVNAYLSHSIGYVEGNGCKDLEIGFLFQQDGADTVIGDMGGFILEAGKHDLTVLVTSPNACVEFFGTFNLTAEPYTPVGGGETGGGETGGGETGGGETGGGETGGGETGGGETGGGETGSETVDSRLVGDWRFEHTEGSDTIVATMTFAANGDLEYKMLYNSMVIDDYKAKSSQVKGTPNKTDIEIVSVDPQAMSQYPTGTVLKCIYTIDETMLERGCSDGSYPSSMEEAEESIVLLKVK